MLRLKIHFYHLGKNHNIINNDAIHIYWWKKLHIFRFGKKKRNEKSIKILLTIMAKYEHMA